MQTTDGARNNCMQLVSTTLSGIAVPFPTPSQAGGQEVLPHGLSGSDAGVTVKVLLNLELGRPLPIWWL